MHCFQNHRMLAHPQIIIGAPDRDFAFTIFEKMVGPGKVAFYPLDVIKHTVTALGLDLGDGVRVVLFIINGHYILL